MTADARPAPAWLPPHDLHNHTVHCGHAADDATVPNLVARAGALGLAWFGFAEHVVFAEDAPRVARVRADLEALPQDGSGPRVLVGMEIDPDPLHLDGRWVAEPEGADFAVLSPHRIPEYGVGHWQFRDLALSAAETERLGGLWLDWYAACVERAEVDILGHPLREPITLGLLSLREDRTLERARGILATAARRGAAFELNNGWALGLERLGQYEPYVALVRDLRAEGMRFSRGSDSHGVIGVGAADGIARLARAAGIEPGDWLAAARLPGARGAPQ
ncbi:MAG: hypothetical protein IT208_11430 [Chthonomonadales bacterium]|nr:hypothetical protein [Chthonomonadales bacterium]